METFSKRETLSDNTQVEYCRQCKECGMWGIGDDPYMNRHDKSCCLMYLYPDHKPDYVINNTGVCTYREVK